MKRIVHISDVHFDRIYPSAVEPLRRTVAELSPDIVVASGDLTQRARKRQYRQAVDFLKSLERPVIVTPGNHDIPSWNQFLRAFKPYGSYRSFVSSELESTHLDDELAIMALNTSRNYTIRSGRITKAQADRAKDFFDRAGRRFKILVTHHPFDVPESAPSGNIVKGDVEYAMHAFGECEVDLFLAGHLHMAQVSTSWKRYRGTRWNAILSNAGTPISTRLRGSPLSFTTMNVGESTANVDVYTYEIGNELFEATERHVFVQGDTGWRMSE